MVDTSRTGTVYLSRASLFTLGTFSKEIILGITLSGISYKIKIYILHMQVLLEFGCIVMENS
jgi:hypothetical protein